MLRIVPSCDLGALGPREGSPVFYYWHWHHSAPGLTSWLVLALALVGPRDNRTRAALWILVPVLLVNLIWLAVALLLKLVTSDRAIFGTTTLSLAVGSALLWLLGHGIANCTRGKGLVLALGLALGAGLLGMLSVLDFSEQMIGFAFLQAILVPALVLGYVLAARMSGRTFRPARFLLVLAAGTAAFSGLGSLLWFPLWSVVTGDWPTHVVSALVEVFVICLILGGCVFLVSLAFVLVGLRSPLFRPRLFACLRLPPERGPAGDPNRAVARLGTPDNAAATEAGAEN